MTQLKHGISSLVLDTQNCLGCCLQRTEHFENVLTQNGPRGAAMNSWVIRVNNLVWERALRNFDFWDGEQWYPSSTPPVHTHSGHPCMHLIGHLTCPSCDFRASIALHGHLSFSSGLFPPFLWPCTHIMSPVFLIFRSQQAHGHLKAARAAMITPPQIWQCKTSSKPLYFKNFNLWIFGLLGREVTKSCAWDIWYAFIWARYSTPARHLRCYPHRPIIARY